VGAHRLRKKWGFRRLDVQVVARSSGDRSCNFASNSCGVTLLKCFLIASKAASGSVAILLTPLSSLKQLFPLNAGPLISYCDLNMHLIEDRGIRKYWLAFRKAPPNTSNFHSPGG
jgi:hypothetical protein